MNTKCEKCGTNFEARSADLKRGRAKYCSLNCSAKHGNSLRSTRIAVNCATCSKSLSRKKSQIKRSKNHFCDRECKQNFEFSGKQRKKRQSNNRRDHLDKKRELLDRFGVVCQHEDCELDLKNDRRVVDLHHLEDSLNHNKTVLLCPYHHRLADLGLL